MEQVSGAGPSARTGQSVDIRWRTATIARVPQTNRQLDDLDRALLARLTADGRASMAELGRDVGLSRTAVLARVQRLERSGIIRGYRAEVVLPDEPHPHRARVGIVIRTADVGGYVRRLVALDGVSEVETVTGEYDLVALLAAPSAEELDSVLDVISGWRETVRTTTWVVLRRYR
jgi:Lrp/AsnC family transcriptional regulator, leucine-responsive regulatory protein